MTLSSMNLTPSLSRSPCLTSELAFDGTPFIEYCPTSLLEGTTRWHGTNRGQGFEPTALPTARGPEIRWLAMCPYVVTRPLGIPIRILWTRFWYEVNGVVSNANLPPKLSPSKRSDSR